MKTYKITIETADNLETNLIFQAENKATGIGKCVLSYLNEGVAIKVLSAIQVNNRVDRVDGQTMI